MSKNDMKEALWEEDTQKDKFLTFTVCQEIYGLEILYVTEIVRVQPITEIPEFPEYIKGIINLRGSIIPVIDMRLLFMKASSEYGNRTCIVVVNIQGQSMGLIVDAVAEVLSLQEQNIVPMPSIKQGGHQFVQGIGKHGESVILLLDCTKLFGYEDIVGTTKFNDVLQGDCL